MLCLRLENKQTVIDKIYNKMSKMEQDRKKEEVKIHQQISNLDLNVKETMETFQVVKREMGIIKARNDTIAKNQDANNQTMFKIRELMNLRNGEIEKKIEERLNDFQVKISELQNTITVLETQIDRASIDNFKSQLVSLKLAQGKMLRNIEILTQEKADQKQVSTETANMKEILESHTHKLVEQQNHVLTVENFMEKYIPITTQTQISETLKAIMQSSNKMRKNLDHYEASKFNELHRLVLEDNGDPTLHNKILEMAQKFNDHKQQIVKKKSLHPSRSLSITQKNSLRKRKTGEYYTKSSFMSNQTQKSKASFAMQMKSHLQASPGGLIEEQEEFISENSKSKFEESVQDFESSKGKTGAALSEDSDDSNEGEESGKYLDPEQIQSIVSFEVTKKMEESLNKFDEKLHKALSNFKADSSAILETEAYARNLHSTFEDFESRISKKVVEIQAIYKKELQESKIDVLEIDTKFNNIQKKYSKLERLIQKVNHYMKDVLESTSFLNEDSKSPLVVSGRGNYGLKPKPKVHDLSYTKTTFSPNKSVFSPNSGAKPASAIQFKNISTRMNLRNRRIDCGRVKSTNFSKQHSKSKNYETPIDFDSGSMRRNTGLKRVNPIPLKLPLNPDRLEPIHNRAIETFDPRDLE